MKLSKLAGLNALLGLALLGAACTPAAAPTPTIDPNMLYTAAAQTVVAQLTQNAPPPTATLAPTQTQAPTATKMASLPTLPPLGTLSPLKTSTSALSAGGDKCQYVTQSPADNSSVKGNTVYNVIWRVKNTGTTTWDTSYVYRFYAAVNKIHMQANGYNLTNTVAPGAEVELKAVAEASSDPGLYDTSWVLTNPQGVNFCSFNIKINVTASAAASEPTAAPAELSSTTVNIDMSGTTGTVTYDGPPKLEFVRVHYTPASGDGKDADLFAISVNGSPALYAKKPGDSTSPTYIDVANFTHVEGSEHYVITITKQGSTGATIQNVEYFHR